MSDELDRQVAVWVAAGYDGASYAHLRALLPKRTSKGRIPFVVVQPGASFPGNVTIDGYETFRPVDPVPEGPYLLVDVDTGPDSLNVTPTDALAALRDARRTPLTIDEGIALFTQFPDVLTERNAYSLAGSRCGDKRVPAVWLSFGKPRLGWCWAGNPHTWLGTASARKRAGRGSLPRD